MEAAEPDGAAGDTVLIVDDHPVVRSGLTALLRGEDWVGRVVEADCVAEAERIASLHPIRVAVVDVGLPDGDGVELTRRLRLAHPGLAVLVLTMTAEPDLARAVLAAGGSGFLVKETGPDLLLAALRTVRDGGLVVGPHLPDAHRVLAAPTPGEGTPGTGPFAALTPRELQLVRLVASGASNPRIARQLAVADKTVRNQLSALLVKVGAADRVQLALLARDAGIA
ncbi:response regulator transcription factor [Tessaracoccus defluvii]|uniref:Response regulator transcription factor n=1 Tax=Tessaracoccus defluvii TaxID=1285901 RepID=A0A7H0H7E2_9ACTN|nr:response regulator transcription factor [Tessaracoccus defluvii]QNP56458.1 response regulator transcription factor [Tessaracoccus defluvii]